MSTFEITPKIIQDHGLSQEEYDNILKILGRTPTITELGIFSVMWSEHCSYKNSKPLLKTYPTTGEQILQGPGENAGIVDFDDKHAIVFKIESHNHPSALEPYQGAATGIGGILRDIFTMGARPIALLDPLRFGNPEDPATKHIISGVIEGISDYGNSVGVPTVGGEAYFYDAYNGNPLVDVMCVGIIEKDKITRAVASGEGNLVVYFGNSTGRDGIHGATFASTELSEESEEKRSAVQVGDPFMEKKIIEATLELIEKQACVAIQDMGAAGLTCSTAEMAGRGNMGITVDLDKVPQRAKNLTAYEIMLSESQERMLCIVAPEKLPLVTEILNKWDLEPYTLGKLDNSGIMRVYHHGELVAELPADKVSDNSPLYYREATRPEYIDTLPDARKVNFADDNKHKEEILSFLASPNISSKAWVYTQYDHMVQTQTVTPPGENAAVLKIHNSKNYCSIATDGNGMHCYIDPYEGGKSAVAESAINVAITGAQPLAITNCLNFGNPMKPENFYQLSEAVRGIAEACTALNTPVTGGNVSLYNENPSGAIWPTPVIGMIGRIAPPSKPVKGAFDTAGRKIYLLGRCENEHLGGSEYLWWRDKKVYAPCPTCNLTKIQKLIALLNEASNENLLKSAHDCSVGGTIVTLCESVMWGNTGANVSLPVENDDLTTALFSEAKGKVIVSIACENSERFESLCKKWNTSCENIGETTNQSRLVINGIRLDIDELKIAYQQSN